MTTPLNPRDLAYGGLLGAAALLLPVLFHVLHLGHVFLPMYLPLMVLAFLATPRIAASTALVVPLVSSVLTGMPPLHPPTAVFMSVELACMAGLASAAKNRWPGQTVFILLPVLLLGRLLQAMGGYLVGLVLELPAGFMSVWSVAKGWPGLVLMMVVIPPLVRVLRPGSGVHGVQNGSQSVL